MLDKAHRFTVVSRVVDDAMKHLTIMILSTYFTSSVTRHQLPHLIDKHVQLILLLKQDNCGVSEQPLQQVSGHQEGVVLYIIHPFIMFYQDGVVSVVQHTLTVRVDPVIPGNLARCRVNK